MSLGGRRILVTGGAGFIGSHIVESLVRQGARVTVYDNLSSGRRDNLSTVMGDIRFVEGDILDYERLSSACRSMEYVSHQAAQLEILLAIADPSRDLMVNTLGTLNVLRAAAENGVLQVINASSACIYGQADGPTPEEHLPVPNWAYGVSKLAAERYGTIYSRYHGLPVVSLRYGITYGPREWYRRVLTIFVKRAMLGEPLVVFGAGDQIRDFVYVGDVVRMHNLCIGCEAAYGESFNVGTGIPTRVADLAHLVASVAEEKLGSKPPVVHEDTAQGAFSKSVPDKKRNPAELAVMLLDVRKARTAVGWRPETELREGIAAEMAWAAGHLDRWEKVQYTAT